MASVLARLHDVRKRLIERRQPAHATDAVALDEQLDRLTSPAEHPFKLSNAQYEQMLTFASFGAPPCGHSCTVSTAFLYRLAALDDLMRFAGWDLTTRGKPARRVYEILRRRTAGERWQRLSNYCGGKVAGRRGFTWWSTLDLYVNDHPRAASRAGLCIDRLPPFPLVLRLRVAVSNVDARVPTVLDAWDQSIFDPTYDSPKPAHGKTISLEDPLRLCQGCDEYVLPPVPAAAIDFLALEDLPAIGFGTKADDALWERVADYYDDIR
jgi:hypothetical protein